MKFIFNEAKNSKLIAERGISFEAIITAIAEDRLLKILNHHNHKKYPNQKILYVEITGEVYAVPCLFNKNGDVFMKAIFPSRKARKLFLKKNR